MRVHRWKPITALAAAASLALAIGAAPSQAIGAAPPQAATPVESTKVSACLSASDLSNLPLTNRHLTEREKCNLAVVLQAYREPQARVILSRNNKFHSASRPCCLRAGGDRS